MVLFIILLKEQGSGEQTSYFIDKKNLPGLLQTQLQQLLHLPFSYLNSFSFSFLIFHEGHSFRFCSLVAFAIHLKGCLV